MIELSPSRVPLCRMYAKGVVRKLQGVHLRIYHACLEKLRFHVTTYNQTPSRQNALNKVLFNLYACSS
jgi:hypothetical protein